MVLLCFEHIDNSKNRDFWNQIFSFVMPSSFENIFSSGRFMCINSGGDMIQPWIGPPVAYRHKSTWFSLDSHSSFFVHVVANITSSRAYLATKARIS